MILDDNYCMLRLDITLVSSLCRRLKQKLFASRCKTVGQQNYLETCWQWNQMLWGISHCIWTFQILSDTISRFSVGEPEALNWNVKHLLQYANSVSIGVPLVFKNSSFSHTWKVILFSWFTSTMKAVLNHAKDFEMIALKAHVLSNALGDLVTYVQDPQF